MADTLNNITLASGTWVNLYTSSGIAVGTKIIVQNIGNGDVYLNTGATTPTSLSAYNVLPETEEKQNSAGDTGAWAFSIRGGNVNVGAA